MPWRHAAALDARTGFRGIHARGGHVQGVHHMSADLINGLFEFCGGLLILNHCRVLLRDKAVAGVSVFSTAVFTSWGFWNLYFYPSLGQWWSFAGGLAIVCANALWLALMFKYRAKP
jgi:hypothetical protein